MNAQIPPSVGSLPLHELLAFEAAARLGSLVRAAGELNVTGSALSHRLSSLQARLGVVLIEREGRGIRITPEGLRHLASMQPALQSLKTRGEGLRESEHRIVRLVVAPAIATAWVLPWLPRLFAADPGLRLDVSTAALPEDAANLDWDVLAHYGSSAPEGTQRVTLITDSLLPVVAPKLLRGGAGSLARDGFTRLPLLRHAQSWSRWMAGAFGERNEPEAQAYFDDATSMLEAAAAGAGVALATGIEAQPCVSNGTLVSAHPYRLPDREYFAEISANGALKPRARSLFAWFGKVAAAKP